LVRKSKKIIIKMLVASERKRGDSKEFESVLRFQVLRGGWGEVNPLLAQAADEAFHGACFLLR
jgi:hypothetical protein